MPSDTSEGEKQRYDVWTSICRRIFLLDVFRFILMHVIINQFINILVAWGPNDS